MSDPSQSAADQAAFDFLFSRVNYERRDAVPYRSREYKLDRMHELLSRLGDPQLRFPIVHIAGTKGKGSTAAFLSSVFTSANYRVGVFSSPHLDRIEERLAIDGEPCETKTLVRLIDRLRPIIATMDAEARDRAGGEIGPTYFEITTALALMHFAAARVDVAVLEVGLGGRLDSTNVCEPICCAITSISFDHMRQLGNTLSAIAREKAGIIKPGIPVVSGVADAEPRDEIRQTAKDNNSRLIEFERDYAVKYHAPAFADSSQLGSATNGTRGESETMVSAEYGRLDYSSKSDGMHLQQVDLGLLGSHQARNAGVALACIDQLRRDGWKISEEAIRQGLRNARCRARIEVLSRRPTVIIDAAHNAASVEALLATLDDSFPPGPRTLVFGTTIEKDVRGMLMQLLPRFDQTIVTRYLNNPRAISPEELAMVASERGATNVRVCGDPSAAWRTVEGSLTEDHLVCVTGSFFIAAEMRREIEVALQQMKSAKGHACR